MRVEVVCALPREQERIVLELPPGSTVLDAVRASGLLQRLPPPRSGHARSPAPNVDRTQRDFDNLQKRTGGGNWQEGGAPPPCSSVRDDAPAGNALLASGYYDLGVWGRSVSPETRLRDRDRVEIYRRLIADPKQVRRERAARKAGR